MDPLTSNVAHFLTEEKAVESFLVIGAIEAFKAVWADW